LAGFSGKPDIGKDFAQVVHITVLSYVVMLLNIHANVRLSCKKCHGQTHKFLFPQHQQQRKKVLSNRLQSVV